MRLLDFMNSLNRPNQRLNNFLRFRTGPRSVQQPTYYFQNVPALNELFEEVRQETDMSVEEFEEMFLQILPDCIEKTYLNSDRILLLYMKKYLVRKILKQ